MVAAWQKLKNGFMDCQGKDYTDNSHRHVNIEA